MFSDDLSVDLLPLLLEVLVLRDLLESLSDINQLGVQLVDLALFCEFEQVSLIVRVKIYWDWFVASVGGDEANIQGGVSRLFGLVVRASEANGGILVGADDMHLSFLWLFPSDFVEELDGLAGLLFDIEAEGLASDAEVQAMRGEEGQKGEEDKGFYHDF